jgi:hypothetical protein
VGRDSEAAGTDFLILVRRILVSRTAELNVNSNTLKIKLISRKRLVTLGVIFILLAIWFYPNINAYREFQAFCKSENRLKVGRKLEINKGWIARSVFEADFPLRFEEVAFVRITDAGKKYDLTAKPTASAFVLKISKAPANELVSPRYLYRYELSSLKSATRLYEIRDVVVDLETNTESVVYKSYSFSFFHPDRTLLSAPSVTHCSDTSKNLTVDGGFKKTDRYIRFKDSFATR